MNEEEMIQWIDQAPLIDLLEKCRTEPVGSDWFVGPVGDYFMETIKQRRKTVSVEEQVAASKLIDWLRF